MVVAVVVVLGAVAVVECGGVVVVTVVELWCWETSGGDCGGAVVVL